MTYNNFLSYMMLNFISLIMILITLLIGVAFLTLLERKLLGYLQMRKGPNKVGVLGIFQPFSDAIKLFSKEFFFIFKSNYYVYYLSPLFLFFFMLSNWMTMKVITNIYYLNYSLLIIILIMGIMGYLVILMGWASNSLYSKIGALRGVAQTLSYEVSFIMIILVLMMMSESYSLNDFSKWQIYFWYLFMMFPLFLMFMISVLAELNRSPMDFVEGESELVSGFNIEYFSGGFALIFMAEYGMIIFFSYLMMMLFTAFLWMEVIFYGIFMMFFVICIIFMRGLLPRMRYDELMFLCWKIFLPLILNYMVFIMGFKFILSLYM